MKPGDKVRRINQFFEDELAGKSFWWLFIGCGLGALIWLLAGCAARKPAIRPGHDREHPSLTPVGKVTCRTGLLKLFGSYGPRNCVNEQDVKPPRRCDGPYEYNWKTMRCERK